MRIWEYCILSVLFKIYIPYTKTSYSFLCLQVKNSKYRTRSGFAQSDGIAQFSASFSRKNNYKIKSFWKQNSLQDDQYRPTSYEPYRPQQPRTIGAFSDDECYLNSASFNGSISSHFPNLDLPYDDNIRPVKTSPSNR